MKLQHLVRVLVVSSTFLREACHPFCKELHTSEPPLLAGADSMASSAAGREPRTVLGLRHAEEDCPSSQQSMVAKPEESMLDESKVIRGTFEVHNQLLPCLQC